MNRIAQCVHHRMDFGISTAASNPYTLFFFESLAIPIDFWGGFGAVRSSLFLHPRLLCEP